MQRIPSFDPSQPTTQPFINVGAANEGSKMLLYNESPYNLDLDFYNGNSSILHAWEARYWTLDGDTKQVGWVIDTALNVTGPPISLIMGELYDASEPLEGSYPMALIRQANVGNAGGIPTTTTTTQIINDGNTLQEVVEATLSGHGSSDVIINNDGSFTLKGAGVLAAAALLTHILGTLTVDQLLTASGGLTLAYLKAFNIINSLGTSYPFVKTEATDEITIQTLPTTEQILFKDSGGTQQGHFDMAGATPGTLGVNRLGVTHGHFTCIDFAAFSPPSGISTITHNFGFTPDVAIWQGGQIANTNPGTTTASIYNCLANSCTINNFASVPGFLLYLKH